MTAGKEPNQWVVKKYAAVGTSEPFGSQFLEIQDILNATLILGEQRKRVSESISMILMDGLLPAFLELRQIRDSVNKDLPVVDGFQLYEDFARKIWKSYKELMQNAAKKSTLSWGFFFRTALSSNRVWKSSAKRIPQRRHSWNLIFGRQEGYGRTISRIFVTTSLNTSAMTGLGTKNSIDQSSLRSSLMPYGKQSSRS